MGETIAKGLTPDLVPAISGKRLQWCAVDVILSGRCGVTKPPSLFAGGRISPLWQAVMTIGSGRRYRCFSAVSFPTRMTRRSPKKSNRSKGAFFELPPELKSQRRQIADFLDVNVCKPPVLEPQTGHDEGRC